MILIINTSKEKLHYLEFVKPIEDILKDFKTKTINYKNLKKSHLSKAKKVIICGTSLQDNEYQKDLNKFEWINNLNKPILGICAGMQLIGLTNSQKLKNKTEIGYFHENFKGKFLGLKGKIEVYHLHKKYIDFKKLKDFKIYNSGIIPQAIKHKKKEIYRVLFHPEVRQKELILNFAKI